MNRENSSAVVADIFPLPVYDRVDPPRVHPNGLGQAALAYVQGAQELLFQNLSRMYWRHKHIESLYRNQRGEKSGPGRDRTCHQPVMSRLLYH